MATPASRPFHLTGPDGPLRGAVRTGGGARPAVVVCHGAGEFERWPFHPVAAERLARAGFAAVSFDGAGAGPGDLDRVLAALRAGDVCDAPPAVGLLGHGAGGAAAVRCAARDPGVKALVTWDVVSPDPLPRLAVPSLALDAGGPEFGSVLDATVRWFARHLA